MVEAFRFVIGNIKFGRGRRWGGIRFRVSKCYYIKCRERREIVMVCDIRVIEVEKRNIISFCYLRGEVRRFRGSRILSVVPLKNKCATEKIET